MAKERAEQKAAKPTGRRVEAERAAKNRIAKVNATLGKKKATVSNRQLNRLAKAARVSSSSNRKSSDGSK